jgi:hypothetical protein
VLDALISEVTWWFYNLGDRVQMNQNRPLKAELILLYGNQANAAQALPLPDYRLSRIINRRIAVSDEDREILARALGAQRLAILLGDERR